MSDIPIKPEPVPSGAGEAHRKRFRRRAIAGCLVVVLIAGGVVGRHFYKRWVALNGLGPGTRDVRDSKSTYVISASGRRSELAFPQTAPGFVYQAAGYRTMAWVESPTTLLMFDVTDEDLGRYADTIPGLTGVWLYDTELTDQGLDSLAAFRSVRHLVLRQNTDGATDAGLVHLRHLSDLRYLQVSGPRFGDGGMKHVGELTGLQRLSWGGIGLTDAGLSHLKRLTRLQSVSLNATQLTGDGLKTLASLPRLKVLKLHEARIDPENLRHLAGHLSLVELVVRAGHATDWKGLRHLKHCPALEVIGIPNCSVDDDDVLQLEGCDGLAGLDLAGTNITDAALRTLACLPRLQWVEVGNTAVTASGIRRLKEEAPGLTVRE